MTPKRKPKPHSSHAMTRWTGAVRAPSGEPRFYSCRICRRCGKEEIAHPAGHFLHGLESKCEMTPKRKPATERPVSCICCPEPRVGVSFCRSCGLAYDRAHRSAAVSSVAGALAWVADRTAKMRKSPLPRAVRELLRDVVLYWGTSGDLDREGKMQPDQQVERAARILGTTPAAIVARARKAGRR